MTVSSDPLEVVRATALTYLSRNSRWLIRQNAEDLAQEVVINFMRAAARQTIDNPAAWAISASKKLEINLIQRNREDAEDLEDDVKRGLLRFLAEGRPTSYTAIVKQQTDLLMAQLNDDEKMFVSLVAMGYPHAEIAEIMGFANAATVKATLYRKRAKLLAAAKDAGLDVNWQEHPRPY